MMRSTYGHQSIYQLQPRFAGTPGPGWNLSEQLRLDGIECRIDQHEESPEEGWPRWCRNQVQESKFVLVVCTEIYKRRYEGKASPEAGSGSKWEGFIVTQAIYDADGKNNKFIPVLFSRADLPQIPEELRSGTHYVVSTDEGPLTTDEGYIKLLAALRISVGSDQETCQKKCVFCCQVAFSQRIRLSSKESSHRCPSWSASSRRRPTYRIGVGGLSSQSQTGF